MIELYRDLMSTQVKGVGGDASAIFTQLGHSIFNPRNTKQPEIREGLEKISSTVADDPHNASEQAIRDFKCNADLFRAKVQSLSENFDLIYAKLLELGGISKFCDVCSSEEGSVKMQSRLENLNNLLQESLDGEYIEVELETNIFETIHNNDGIISS